MKHYLIIKWRGAGWCLYGPTSEVIMRGAYDVVDRANGWNIIEQCWGWDSDPAALSRLVDAHGLDAVQLFAERGSFDKLLDALHRLNIRHPWGVSAVYVDGRKVWPETRRPYAPMRACAPAPLHCHAYDKWARKPWRMDHMVTGSGAVYTPRTDRLVEAVAWAATAILKAMESSRGQSV